MDLLSPIVDETDRPEEEGMNTILWLIGIRLEHTGDAFFDFYREAQSHISQAYGLGFPPPVQELTYKIVPPILNEKGNPADDKAVGVLYDMVPTEAARVPHGCRWWETRDEVEKVQKLFSYIRHDPRLMADIPKLRKPSNRNARMTSFVDVCVSNFENPSTQSAWTDLDDPER